MTPLKFKKRILKLFKNQAAAARALGVVPSAVANWVSGRNVVPPTIEKLLECIESHRTSTIQ